MKLEIILFSTWFFKERKKGPSGSGRFSISYIACSVLLQHLNQNLLYLPQVCRDLKYCMRWPNRRNFHTSDFITLAGGIYREGDPYRVSLECLQAALLITALVTGGAKWNRATLKQNFPFNSQLFSLTADKSLLWQEQWWLSKMHFWIPQGFWTPRVYSLMLH